MESPRDLIDFVLSLYILDNLKIYEVSEAEYFAATDLAADLKMDPNDALAVDFMRRNGIDTPSIKTLKEKRE